MNTQLKQKVVSFLKQIGLDDEQALIYLYLQEKGPSSVLAISRGLKTGRTKLYPALQVMVNKQVIAAKSRHYGTSYEALPPENLEFIVSEYERKASAVRYNLTAAIHALNTLRLESPTSSKVIEYRGIEGLKQANYNLLKAKDTYRVFEKANLDQHAGMSKHFVEKFRQTQVDRNITGYDLTNNPHYNLETKVEDIDTFRSVRYINTKIFEIKFETYVYNNVVTLLNYDPNDIVCIEIHNQALADQQRQIFDLLWGMGKDIKS